MDCERGVQIGTFFIVSTNMVLKNLMFLHHVNIIKNDIILSMLGWKVIPHIIP